MTIWEKMGIKHLSPSANNEFISHPAIWAHKYIAGIRDGGNAKMWRGTAIEKGAEVLMQPRGTMSAALAMAYDTFTKLVNKHKGPQFADLAEVSSQRQLIAPMLEQFSLWQRPGMLLASQLRVELHLEGIDIPMIGYVDFTFEDGVDVDLKTTEAIKNTLPDDHARQVSFYREARRRRGGLIYVTGKKYNFLEVDDATKKRSIDELTESAHAMKKFLELCGTKENVLSCLHVDWSNWKAPERRRTIKETLAHVRGEVSEVVPTF